MLEDQYCKDTTDGMKGLLDETPNKLTKCKANVVIKVADVQQESAAEATRSGKAAQFTTNEDY